MLKSPSTHAYGALHSSKKRIWSVPTGELTVAESVEAENGGARIFKNVCDSLEFTPRASVDRDTKIFTIGSCFAREVEEALLDLKFTVLTRDADLFPFPAGHLNRYNSPAMSQEIEFALGRKTWLPESIVSLRLGFSDLTSFGAFPTVPEALDYRTRTTELFRRLESANLVIVTAGLSEVWFDRKYEQFTNIAPSEASKIEPERFEFRLLDYKETRDSLERLLTLIRSAAPRANILLTVSPVPLNATFLPRDVLISNCYSKAVLRASVEELYWKYEFIDYFPSYEMVTLSDPAEVWESDHRHVRRKFIDDIMRVFVTKYVRNAG